ncbi:ATP-binding cassette domain-containing protein [Mollicutes bacterium LVI A0078]|nr:ATP-binding cassette domain-containing protein [Mollicutes bacterium LVI A0075]WOO91357.1 ATP-binding cassette domain-containing protein [Mollicutes bacterium LVI A0078]
MIKLRNVSKQFGNKQIISNLDLDINQGEIVGLIGLSGAGKSTLLRIINNLEQATSGEVIIKDNIKFGFIFQTFNLVNSLTVRDNIKLALVNSTFTESEKETKVIEVLNLVGLEAYIDSKPKELSGGQKQRVGIARSLIADVDVLLCDEATSALDPFTANEIINLLGELNKKLGLTIVFVSHQLEIVRDFCDRIAIIDNGVLCEVDTTINVFSKPKSNISIKLLGNVLGFERYLDDPTIGLITCYSKSEIKDCYTALLENNVDIEATYQHHTKQGVFAHFFIRSAEQIAGYEIRRINGL